MYEREAWLNPAIAKAASASHQARKGAAMKRRMVFGIQPLCAELYSMQRSFGEIYNEFWSVTLIPMDLENMNGFFTKPAKDYKYRLPSFVQLKPLRTDIRIENLSQ